MARATATRRVTSVHVHPVTLLSCLALKLEARLRGRYRHVLCISWWTRVTEASKRRHPGTLRLGATHVASTTYEVRTGTGQVRASTETLHARPRLAYDRKYREYCLQSKVSIPCVTSRQLGQDNWPNDPPPARPSRG
ncbi:hypothetical protein OH76DRAFT_1190166 [Lentinus brumalis]|uniref:Uncharacterized protein n=1 Tax=Lentinus brumalis TaxID=2498619 RepID=A0A371CTH2_9APHY|nr:hypothetical protein OH76DRAFT_1190166 [Polyporus brumalis]